MALGANKIFKTGIPNLDLLLGGGIPRRQALIVTGSPGGGKTILVNQIAFLAAAQGLPVVFATLTSEPHDKLVEQLSGFKFFRGELLGEQVFLINTYAAMKKSGKEARDVLLGTVRERAARLLVIDGMRSMRDLWQDEARLRERMRQSDAEDSAWLGVLRAARLEIVHDAQHMSPAVQHRAAFTGNPPRFHAAIEQWRLQCRFEALDLPCDRRGRQEQPLGCPL